GVDVAEHGAFRGGLADGDGVARLVPAHQADTAIPLAVDLQRAQAPHRELVLGAHGGLVVERDANLIARDRLVVVRGDGNVSVFAGGVGENTRGAEQGWLGG